MDARLNLYSYKVLDCAGIHYGLVCAENAQAAEDKMRQKYKGGDEVVIIIDDLD